MSNVQVVVFGCHRSGTSLVAGILNDAVGVPMGQDLIGANQWNPKGHFEDRKVVEINETIFSKLNTNWKEPWNIVWREDVQGDVDDRIHAYVTERNSMNWMWGMKDPRLCLTWEYWKHHMDRVYGVFVYRDALNVVNSILRRDYEGVECSRMVGDGKERTKEIYNCREDVESIVNGYLDSMGNVSCNNFTMVRYDEIRGSQIFNLFNNTFDGIRSKRATDLDIRK